MSKLLITRDPYGWQVWVTLDDHDPLRDRFGFIIGEGTTRDRAVMAAVADLECSLAKLQEPQGSIEERDI